jgi:hypothetical protein
MFNFADEIYCRHLRPPSLVVETMKKREGKENNRKKKRETSRRYRIIYEDRTYPDEGYLARRGKGKGKRVARTDKREHTSKRDSQAEITRDASIDVYPVEYNPFCESDFRVLRARIVRGAKEIESRNIHSSRLLAELPPAFR